MGVWRFVKISQACRLVVCSRLSSVDERASCDGGAAVSGGYVGSARFGGLEWCNTGMLEYAGAGAVH